MRSLLWFTLGFGAACGLCAYGRHQLIFLLPLAVLLLSLLTGEKKTRKFLISAVGIAFGLIWFSRFESRVLAPVYAMDGTTQSVTIRCNTFPEETDYGFRTEGTLRIDDRDYTVLCYLKPGTEVSPGVLLSGPFKFRATAPGALADSPYYQGEKIFLLAYPEGKLTMTQGEGFWRDHVARLRHEIIRILDETLPEDAARFSKALMLGEASDLDYETKTDLTVSGIRHIVAVSGLHVSILFSMMSHFSFRSRFLFAVILFPTLLVFAALTGFTPSVSRACIMSGLMLFPKPLKREYDGPCSLSFAALLLLLHNPLAITSGSFQLSFSSVAGIYLFSTRLYGWLSVQLYKKLPAAAIRYLATSVSITLGATVLTVPLSALQFGTVSLAAVVTNLLVLWVVSIIFYGLIALCLAAGTFPAATLVLSKVLTMLIRYVLTVAKGIADFPLAAVYTRSPYIAAWVIFGCCLLILYLVTTSRKADLLLLAMTVSLCIALLASWAEPRMDETRFTVLDVGQGQSLLLQTEGKTFLVDCGGSNDTVAADAAAETLLSQGISRLDGLIVTHMDSDHAGAVGELLTRVDTDLLILPPVFSEETWPAEKTIYAAEELQLSAGTANIRIYPTYLPGNDNENSICILFDTKNCDILVTGDRSGLGEQSLLQYAAIPDVDVLVAGHHGSKLATSEELLEAVRPEIVCISVARKNAFGHPAPELLARLEHFGCSVYRTDLQGDIIIRR